MTTHHRRSSAGQVLAIVAGADRRALALAPSEQPRWVTAGLSLLSATLLAVITGTLAGTITTGHTASGLAVGLVLGGLVYVLDRSLLATDAGPIATVLRVTASIALAVLVAEPALVVIFDDEIAAELDRQHATALTEAHAQALADLDADIARLDNRTEQLEVTDPAVTDARQAVRDADNEVADALADVDRLTERLDAELNGTGAQGSTGTAGDGPAAAQIRSDLTLATNRLATAETLQTRADETLATALYTASSASERAADELDEIADERARLETERASLADTVTVPTARGLLARIAALEHLASTSPAMATAIWLLRILFVLLDTGPIVAKVAGHRPGNPYDTARELLRTRDHRNITRQLDLIGHGELPEPERHGIRGLLVDEKRIGHLEPGHERRQQRPLAPTAIGSTLAPAAFVDRGRSAVAELGETLRSQRPRSQPVNQ